MHLSLIVRLNSHVTWLPKISQERLQELFKAKLWRIMIWLIEYEEVQLVLLQCLVQLTHAQLIFWTSFRMHIAIVFQRGILIWSLLVQTISTIHSIRRNMMYREPVQVYVFITQLFDLMTRINTTPHRRRYYNSKIIEAALTPTNTALFKKEKQSMLHLEKNPEKSLVNIMTTPASIKSSHLKRWKNQFLIGNNQVNIKIS